MLRSLWPLLGPGLWVLLGVVAPPLVAGGLSPEEARGKAIYFQGDDPEGGAVWAQVGEEGIQVPAAAVPCASCHGPDGLGRPEGGVLPPNITWSELIKPYGHTHPNGRRHPAFDEASVDQVVAAGLDPAGNRLDPAMPRYRLPAEAMHALVAYLRRLEHDRDPGIGEDSVRLATLLPLDGPSGALGRAMGSVMLAYFEDLNAAGGIHGRRLELEIIPYRVGPDATLETLRKALTQREYFAVVGAFVGGLEGAAADLMEELEIPSVGPFSSRTHGGSELNLRTFYIYSGERDQARVLAEYATTLGKPMPSAILLPATWEADEAHAVADELTQKGWPSPRMVRYVAAEGPAPGQVRGLRESGVAAVFYLGGQEELDSWLRALGEGDGPPPLVLLPALLARRPLFDLPEALDGRVFLAYPTLPADVTPRGREGFAALRARHELPAEHLQAQIAAYVAAKTLAEGIKRGGRYLSRDGLIHGLERLYQFETGLTPPLSYGANRRVGALGAHVVRLDLKNRRYVPVGPWIPLAR